MADRTFIRTMIEKALEISRQFHANTGMIADFERNAATLKSANEELRKQIDSFRATASTFGFNLDEEVERFLEERRRGTYGPAAQVPRPETLSERRRTVKDLVLAAVETAFPGPARAAEIRKNLEQEHDITTHVKTVGMSLYRLFKEGKVRRAGKADWYYVPASERQQTPQRERPGSDPGLLFENTF